jgi:poly-gamma-glutamate synthesis protein (capsule biosynthesis protein)
MNHRHLNKSAVKILSIFLVVLFRLLSTSPNFGKTLGKSCEEVWVYTRDDQPPKEVENLIEVIAVGDVMPGRNIADQPGLFFHVEEELRGADLVIGNLEGVIAPHASLTITPTLHILSSNSNRLARSGFDFLGLANNHTLDSGQEGLVSTIQNLIKSNIEPLQHSQPFITEIKGVKLGLLAWNDTKQNDHSLLFSATQDTRSKSDFLILLIHWGQEYQRHPNQYQRDLAKQLLEYGADIILGSHPHVVQDLELVGPRVGNGPPHLVAYSLGNFIFDQGWDDTAEGLALRILIDSKSLRGIQVLPLRTSPRPVWMSPCEAEDLLSRILPVNRLGFTCTDGTCQPFPVQQTAQDGRFWSGAIDLTGNGHPEIIKRQGDSVYIFKDGQLEWHSPKDWQIDDLALGDPNHDGRYEVILAFQKAGRDGILTSHPFILGYRNGNFRILWGGSAVSDPILEIDLEDLNGDGLEELVVIEKSIDHNTEYLAIWRWHGWGFSLVWRSQPGNYEDLTIIPASKNLPARISVTSEAIFYP